ncbi:MAG: phytoene desaturase family protein [Candidatus Nomurabacteria bacterium]|nr:phytoene desaturase family protein [Candidatus Nomurabacteria bacterium]
MKNKKVVVIGAGFGGLATAADLAQKGFEVLILEKNEMAGGRARVFKNSGFTFDMGPSWYMMLEYFERFFQKHGHKSEDFYKTILLDPSYRINYEDGTVVEISADLEKNIALFENIEKGAGQKLREYLKEAERKYHLSTELVLQKSVNNFFDFFSFDLLRKASGLNVFQNLDSYVRKFFKDEKLVQIIEYITLFLGSSPKQLPAVYSLMNYADFVGRVWYPLGGMGKVVEAFVKIAEEEGVKIIYNQDITKIKVENNQAVGVYAGETFYEADIVISNADYPFTETVLLDKEWQSYDEKYWQTKKISPSAFILYIGLNKKLKNARHHNYFFRKDWAKHFDSVFENPAWEDKPSYYLCVPSISDPSVAPEGHENLFFLVPAAPGLADDGAFRKEYRDKMMRELESLLGEKIEDNIVYERIYSQSDFEKDYHAHKGTALGMALSLMQTGFFRPHNKSKKVKNLFYAGQYTHPGCGMAPCIISGENVARDISKTYGK